MSAEITRFLEDIYNQNMAVASGKTKPETELPQDITEDFDVIVDSSESNKGVLAVVLTSAVYKRFHPEQDIRKHQSSIVDGYSGRTFDSNFITPFLKDHRFPAMAESGWLTRSLEQKVPYELNYTGAIKPQSLKESFLYAIDAIQNSGRVDEIIDYMLQSLIIQRDNKTIEVATPQNLSIANIMALLQSHFRYPYKASGASRLPVLALYAIYQCLVKELKRYEGKRLLEIENHNSADTRSGRKGDIDIVNEDGSTFEAVEVKFDIPVSHNIVENAKEKIQTSTIERYYILSTSEVFEPDREKIAQDIKQIKNVHGCQLVVNGVMPTLKYYLRLLDNTREFIGNYASLVETDKTIKFEHKQAWNKLVSEMD